MGRSVSLAKVKSGLFVRARYSLASKSLKSLIDCARRDLSRQPPTCRRLSLKRNKIFSCPTINDKRREKICRRLSHPHNQAIRHLATWRDQPRLVATCRTV